jgi:hypothetical protein
VLLFIAYTIQDYRESIGMALKYLTLLPIPSENEVLLSPNCKIFVVASIHEEEDDFHS